MLVCIPISTNVHMSEMYQEHPCAVVLKRYVLKLLLVRLDCLLYLCAPNKVSVLAYSFDQMPVVTRADCTQIDTTEAATFTYSARSGLSVIIEELNIDFNSS